MAVRSHRVVMRLAGYTAATNERRQAAIAMADSNNEGKDDDSIGEYLEMFHSKDANHFPLFVRSFERTQDVRSKRRESRTAEYTTE